MQRRRRKPKRMRILMVTLAAGSITSFYFSNKYIPEAQAEAPTVRVIESEWENDIPILYEIDWCTDDSYMFAKIAMAEAEGEGTEGKALVMRTVLNRVESKRFPYEVEDVIFQDGAFTSIQNGRYDRVEPDADCYAALALIESGWDESMGALYFERTTDDSTWHSRNLEKLFTHGKHTFYTEVEAE